MDARKVLVVVAAVAAGLWAGCGAYTHSVAPRTPLSPAGKNFEACWQASQEVLRRYFFEMDVLDRRAGLLKTQPLTGRAALEFWRKDAVTPYDVTESTLQTVYRQVEVRIEPVPGTDQFRPVVRAYAYRSDRRQPQFTSTSEAYKLFMIPGGYEYSRESLLLEKIGTGPEPIEETEKPPKEQGKWLVPLGDAGRDHDLEAVLTAKIERYAEKIRPRLP